MYYGFSGLGATTEKAAWDQCKRAESSYANAVEALRRWEANEAEWKRYDAALATYSRELSEYERFKALSIATGKKQSEIMSNLATSNAQNVKDFPGLSFYSCLSARVKDYATRRCEEAMSIQGLGQPQAITQTAAYNLVKDHSAVPYCAIARIPTCPYWPPMPVRTTPMPVAPKKPSTPRYSRPSVPGKPGPCGPEPLMDGSTPPPPPMIAPPPPPPPLPPVRTALPEEEVVIEEDDEGSNLAIYGILALLVVASGGYAYYRYRQVA